MSTPPPHSAPRLDRRGFLLAGAGTAAGLALPGTRWLGLRTPARAASRDPFAASLPIPERIDSASVRLTARQSEHRILAGDKTRMWTYSGQFPGPTIRRPAGAATEVSFRHSLPRSAGDLTLHLHGGHTGEASDGQPGGHPGDSGRDSLFCRIGDEVSGPGEDPNRFLVAPGGSRTYAYPGTEDGAAERPAFQWYHDHRCAATAENVWRGLAGMWIIEDPDDAERGLPTGRRDVELMIGDRTLDRRNQLTDPFKGFRSPPDDGTVGRRVLVNGRITPHLDVEATTYRLRILNASLFQSYNLALPGDRPFVQVGTDSGLLRAPRELTRLLIGPGERAEIVIDFSRLRGRRVVLSSARRNPSPRPAGFGSAAHVGALMQFRVSDRRRPAPPPLASELSTLPAWVEGVDPGAEPEATWRLGIEPGLTSAWGFDVFAAGGQPGAVKPFDAARVDLTAELGSTQVWRISNPTSAAHLIHLHHTDWYVLRRERVRDGEEGPVYEPTAVEPLDGLKETFFLDSDEAIVLAGRLTDHRGRFIVHCHMLDHEDHGLMAQFEVV